MTVKNTERSLKGKWIAVSGATGGIGSFLVRYIAALGGNLIFLDRNIHKSTALRNEVIKEYPYCDIRLITIDMEEIESVKNALIKLKEFPLYGLIHNAGAYSIKRKKSSTGFDNLFQINFVSPYFLTKELLPILRENRGKVVAVGSIAHHYSKTDLRDIDFSGRKANSLAYGNAKRFLMLSHFGAFKEEENCSLSVVHPGIAFTGITNHYPKIIFALIKHPMKIIFMKPKKAALSVLEGLFESTNTGFWIGPKFFDIWGQPKLKRINGFSKSEMEEVYKTAESIYQKLSE
jgi:short-subunit dehydrogenase